MSNKVKIALTGYTGFLGEELLKALAADNHELLLLGRKKIPELKGSFLYFDHSVDENKLSINDCETVIHCAGLAHQLAGANLSSASQKHYYNSNVLTTKKILNICIRSGVKKIIYVSTIKVNASVDSETVLHDDAAGFDKNDLYARTKFEAEQEIILSCKKHNIEYIIFRPVIMYGSRLKGNLKKLDKFFELFKFSILPFGCLNNPRSLLSVTNFCDLILLACYKRVPSGVYIACDDEVFSTSQIINLLSKKNANFCLNLKVPKYFLYLISTGRLGVLFQKLDAKLVADNSKAKHVFGWAPQKSFASILKDNDNHG
jgi:UDP-glucose 4-epimerase